MKGGKEKFVARVGMDLDDLEAYARWCAVKDQIEHSIRNLNDGFSVPEGEAPDTPPVFSSKKKDRMPTLSEWLGENDGL